MDWAFVEMVMLQNYSCRWARECLRLMRRYAHSLCSGDASSLLTLGPHEWLEAMKARGMLSRV
ncbi:MAG: hypothetical protein QXP81_10430 [Nitrososphaerota archaeon]|nr:hypothetical protein [Candidatus Calditenuis fumarioli]